MVRQNQKDFVLAYPCDINPIISGKIYHFVAIDQTKVLRYWEQAILCFMMKFDLDKWLKKDAKKTKWIISLHLSI